MRAALLMTTVLLILGLLVAPTGGLAPSHSPLARLAAAPLAKATSAAPAGFSHSAARPSSVVSAGGRVYQTTWTSPLGSTQAGYIAVDTVSRTVYSIQNAAALLVAFNGFTGAFERSIVLANGSSGVTAQSIAFDNLTGRLYVGLTSSTYGNEIAVIAAATFAWVTNISYTGAGIPTFSPYREYFEYRTNQLFVENSSTQDVVVVNTTTNTVATWLAVPCSGIGSCTSYYGMFAMTDSIGGPLVVIPAATSYAYVIVPSATPTSDFVAAGFNASTPGVEFAAGTFSSVTNLTYFTNYSYSGDVAAYDQTGALVGVSHAAAPGFPYAMTWDEDAGQLAIAVYNGTSGSPGADLFLVDAGSGFQNAQISNASLAEYQVIDDVAAFDAANGTPYLVTSGQYGPGGELLQIGTPTITLSVVRTYSINAGTYLFPVTVDPALGIVVELGYAGTVYGISETTGARLWTNTLPGALSSYWLTTDAADGVVYASTTLAIVALSASTGVVEATFPMTYSANYIAYGFNHLLYATDGPNDTIQAYSNAGGATTLTWAKTIALPASSNACSLSASPVAPVVADLACGIGFTTQISSSATGTTIATVTGSTAGYASVFNASGYLFVGNDTLLNKTGDVLVFNPTTWTLVRTLWTAVPVDFLDFVPQLNAVMVGGFRTSLVLANATTGATLAKFGTPGYTEWPATDWSTGAIVAAGATGETLLADLVALPGVASGLAVHGGNGTLSVTWGPASAASGYPITGYTVYTSSSASGPWTSAGSATQTIENLTGLTDGTTYYVTVRATSGSGTGALAAAVSGVPVGVPYPPTGVTIGTATTSSLVVSWGAPSATGGAAISAYTVLYATSASGPWSTASAGTTTTATVSGLTSGTTYFVKVEAANSAGTGNPSSAVQGKTGGSAPGSSSGGLSGGSWLWIAVAVIVVVAVVLLALAMMMRRKKSSPTAPGMAPGGSGSPPPGAAGGEPPMPPPGAQ